MADRQASSFQKSALIRWIEDEKRQTLVSDAPHSSEELLEGELICYKVKNGFSLHGGVSKELKDFQVISTAKKALIFVVLLEGKLDFSYDDLRFEFDAKTEPVGVVINLTKPVTFRRIIQKNNDVTKLNIVLPVQWVKDRIGQDANVGAFISQHLANQKLELTEPVMKMIADIFRTSSPQGLAEKILLESLTHKLLSEIFQQVEESLPSEYLPTETVIEGYTGKHKSEHSMDELITYIEMHLDQDLTAKELAQYTAMSESSLQRKFKSTHGCSTQSYIRRRRLDIARQHLERGVASVTEVAYNAGYKHPSNFTIAFKKAFGYPPANFANKGG